MLYKLWIFLDIKHKRNRKFSKLHLERMFPLYIVWCIDHYKENQNYLRNSCIYLDGHCMFCKGRYMEHKFHS
jgi:hypothetical protein